MDEKIKEIKDNPNDFIAKAFTINFGKDTEKVINTIINVCNKSKVKICKD